MGDPTEFWLVISTKSFIVNNSHKFTQIKNKKQFFSYIALTTVHNVSEGWNQLTETSWLQNELPDKLKQNYVNE